MADTALTPKALKAINFYIAEGPHRGKKTEAYKAAYSTGRMKDSTIRRKAVELFAKPAIADMIKGVMGEAVENIKADAAWLLGRLYLIATFNIKKFITIDQSTGVAYYDFRDATDDDWYCISEYTVKGLQQDDKKYRVDEVRIKTASRLEALKIIGQHVDVRAFASQVELSAPGGGPIEIKTLNDFYSDIAPDADSGT